VIRERVGNEKGVALVATILVGAVMILMVAGLTAYGIKSQNISRRDQDWNAALSAAEAGVDDYIYRLNQNTTYYLYGAGTSPPDGNVAFTQWVPVPGGNAEGEFRYTPNSSNFLTTGIIELTSSGRVNGEVRTIHTILRRRAFIDFLYFTWYETKDPARYTGVGEFTIAQADAQCGNRFFYGALARDSSTTDGDFACSDINFISADTIKGPMHTNDAMLLCGSPQFQGEATTTFPGTGSPIKLYRTNTACSTNPGPGFLPGFPQKAGELTFPASNNALRAAADPALGGDGCVYTGPTSIRMLSTGQMVVNSPFTRVRSQPACAGPATRSATFTPTPPQTVNLPPNGVVYVQGVPGTGDPNFTSATDLNTRCPTTSVPTSGNNVSVRQNPLGYPRILTSGGGNPNGYDITPGYGCTDGDAFVAGTLNGQLTIGASDTIIAAAYNSSNSTTTSAVNMDNGHASEDIRYNSTAGNTVLGLAANIYVEVFHPMEDDGDEMLNDDNITIQAAVMSVLHSFVVQNYNMGESHNDLSVFGAIAQKYRGLVGTFSGSSVVTGYAKDYVYDNRLRFLSPPSWVSPVESQWRVKTFSELQPAY
jgi:hypothetical protein